MHHSRFSSVRCLEATISPSAIIRYHRAFGTNTVATVRFPASWTGLPRIRHNALKTPWVRSWFRWAIRTVRMEWIEPPSTQQHTRRSVTEWTIALLCEFPHATVWSIATNHVIAHRD